MSLRYISFDLDVPDSIDQYSRLIEAAIAQQGVPIRWAITSRRIHHCTVEAVFLDTDPLSSTRPTLNKND